MSRAVVIGAGIAGLFCAKALSKHFSDVTVIDRDDLSQGSGMRAAIPQANHNHVLVLGGYRSALRLFPDLGERLCEHGAIPVDWFKDLKMYRSNGWRPRFDSDAKGVACNRATFEAVIRASLQSTNICFLAEHTVIELTTGSSTARVTGVVCRSRSTGHVRKIEADLVVDASGRGAITNRWLSQKGYPPVWETHVDPLCSYSTRWYRRLSSSNPDWKLFKVAFNQDYGRVASIVQTGVSEWVVTLQGFLGDYPPTDEKGFLEFAKSLPVSDVFDAIQDAEPLTDIIPYRRMQNVWRHYEQVPRWPESYLVVGDAACILNPAYGLGMTVAIRSANLLDDMLKQGRLNKKFSQDFQRRLAKTLRIPWLITTEQPFWLGGPTQRVQGWRYKLQKRYYKALSEHANFDPITWGVLQEVIQLAKHPNELLRPHILGRLTMRALLRSGLFSYARGSSDPIAVTHSRARRSSDKIS